MAPKEKKDEEKELEDVTLISETDYIQPDSEGRSENFGSFVIAASILAGCVLIAASLFYSSRVIVKGFQDHASTIISAAPSPSPSQAPSGPAAPAQADIKLASDVPFMGAQDAKVTVVEFADYQCPFCEKWHQQVWPSLKTKYIDTNKVKFVYQNFAFLGPDSTTAAEAVQCAKDQGKYWEYHEYLFTHQGQENGGWATADNQKKFAKALGLNASQFNQCLDSHKYTQKVQDETTAGQGYGVSGTPTVFVNGKPIVGAQPYATLEQAIESALK